MAGQLRGWNAAILAADGAGQQAWRQLRRLPRSRDDRRVGRDSHEREHELVAEAIAGDSRAASSRNWSR
jgi:hypothetical protein